MHVRYLTHQNMLTSSYNDEQIKQEVAIDGAVMQVRSRINQARLFT